jgi:hypothetical protein
MALAEERTGTYDEFRKKVLPRIRDAGYGAIQIMALAEHPYYGTRVLIEPTMAGSDAAKKCGRIGERRRSRN